MIEVVKESQNIPQVDSVGIDVQIKTAKQYPRNFERCLNEAIAMATMDEEMAESCIYAIPRGFDKNSGEQNFIKGESVRLAEILMSSWGNMHAATRIIGNDGKVIIAEGAAWDLEKNVKMMMETQRRITDKAGRTFNQDMQVVTGNAAASIALRNAILRVIPRAFAKKVYQAAVNYALGDQTKLSEKRTSVFNKFKKNWGIENEKILKYFEKDNIEDITREDLEEIIGIGTAIVNKDIQIDKAFERVPNESLSKASNLESILLEDSPRNDIVSPKIEPKMEESMANIFEKNIKGEKK